MASVIMRGSRLAFSQAPKPLNRRGQLLTGLPNVVTTFAQDCEAAVAPGTNWTAGNQGAGDPLAVVISGGTIQTTTTAGEVIFGSKSVKLAPGGAFTTRLSYVAATNFATWGMRGYVRLAGLPAADSVLCYFNGSVGGLNAMVKLSSTTGRIRLEDVVGTTVASPVTALTLPGVYGIDLTINAGTAAGDGSGQLRIYNLDGSTFYDSGLLTAQNFFRPGGIAQARWELTTNYAAIWDAFAAVSNSYGLLGPAAGSVSAVVATATGVAPTSITVTGGASVAAVVGTGSGTAPAPAVTGGGGTAYITDTFTGTDGAAWNAGNWTQANASTGSTATLLTNQGRLNMGTNTGYSGLMAMRYAGGTAADTEITGQFTFPNWLSADGSLSIRCRADTSLSSASAYALFISPGAGLAQVQAIVGSATVLGSSIVQSFTQGSAFSYRFRVVGTTIQARIWQGAEPSTWDVNVTDSTIPGPGSFGFRGTGGAAAGCVIDHDNVTITNGAGGTGNPAVFAVGATGTGVAPAPAVIGSVPGGITVIHAAGTGLSFPPTILGTMTVFGGGPGLGNAVADIPTAGGAPGASVTDIPATAAAAPQAPGVDVATTLTGGGPGIGNAVAIPPVVTVIQSGSVTGVVAAGTGASTAPVVAGTLSGTVTAVAAAGTSIAVAPTIPLSPTVTAVRATGTGSITSPAVSGIQSPSIVGVAAVGTGTAGIPSLGSGASASVVRAQTTGAAGTPVVTGAASITGVIGTGTGVSTSPTVTAGAITTDTLATAFGVARIPVVIGSQNVSVTAVVATGSAAVRTPTVVGLASGSALATRAQGTGSTGTPVPTGVITISTTAVRATGSALATAPIGNGGTVLSLPVVVGSGVVTGWFAAGFNATPDSDGLANLIPDVGTVTFTPVHSPLLYPTATPSPLVLFPKPVVCSLGIGSDAGYLLGTDGTRGVHLIATDWVVSFQLTGEATPSVTITVTNGSSIDLSTKIAP